MIKIKIYKSKKSFSVNFRLTQEYKDFLMSIDGMFFKNLNHKIVIPTKFYDEYINKLRQLFTKVKIKVYDADSFEYNSESGEDEEENEIKKVKSDFDEVVVIYKDEFILIPIEQEKKAANEIIVSMCDYQIDLDLWMWKVPINQKTKLFENLSSKKFFINEFF